MSAGTLFVNSNNQVLLYLDDATGSVSIGSSNNPTSTALYVRGSLTTECNVVVTGSIVAQGGVTTCNATYLANSNDTAAFPSFSWRQQSNVGMYLAGNQTIGMSTTGTERARLDGTQLMLNSNVRLTLQAPGGLGQFLAASNACIGVNTLTPAQTLTVSGSLSALGYCNLLLDAFQSGSTSNAPTAAALSNVFGFASANSNYVGTNLYSSNITACNAFACNLSSSNLVCFSNATFGGGATISSWSLGGTWINLPTSGPSGIGTGGPGANPFLAYVNVAGNWFTNSIVGDTAYRNTGGRLVFGNTATTFAMSLSNDQVSVFGTSSNFNNVSIASNLVVAGAVTSAVTTFASNTSVFASNTAANVNVVARTGRLIGYRVLTSGTSYVPTVGSCNLMVTVVGGGGSGGGAVGSLRYGGGGGGGGTGKVFLSNVDGALTCTYAIGAGATTTGSQAGTTGGTTSITVGTNTFSASGGAGGAAGTLATASLGGVGGNTFVGPFTLTVPGEDGSGGFTYDQFSGRGGGSLLGYGGQERFSCNVGLGNPGDGYGGGGGGAATANNTALAGGSGAPGIIVIEEYT